MTDHLAAYQRDGFAHFRQFVAGEDFDELVRRLDRFISQVVPGMEREEVFYEDKDDASTLKQVQNLGAHDPWFHSLFVSGPLRDLAETLLQGPAVPKNLQFFNKPPGIGQPTPAHQDGYYFMLEPCEALTMWLALEAVDEENGCVRYVKGSHRAGMREHGRTKTLGFSQGIVDFPTEADLAAETPLPAGPGDLLVHDALTVHRADGNRSPNRTRRALGFVYFSERARENRGAQAAYQEKLTEELKTCGKI